MSPSGRCYDLLEYVEQRGFDAASVQTDENGLDAIDNAIEWLNRAADGFRYVLAEFGVVVAIAA